MQLAIIVTLVFAACSAHGQAQPLPATPSFVISVWLATVALTWFAQGWLVSKTIVRWQYELPGHRTDRQSCKVTELFPAAWLLTNLAVVMNAGVHQAVWQLAPLPEPILRNLIAALTVLAPLPLAWSCQYELDHWRSLLSSSEKNCTRSRGSFVMQRVLHFVLPVLGPILFVSIANDVFMLVPLPPIVSGLAAVAALGAIVIGLPWLLGWAWRCQPVGDRDLACTLEEWTREFQLPANGVLVWPTGGQIANAFVCGALPIGRKVFLSDRLLSTLSSYQVRCVLAHEAAHIRRRHLPRLLLLLALPVLAAVARSYTTNMEPNSTTTGLLLVGSLALLMGWAGRTAELDADFQACRMLSGHTSWHPCPQTTRRYRETLCLLEGRGPSGGERWHWLHPSLSTRCDRLQALAASAADARAWLRRRHRSDWGIAVALGLATYIA